MTYTLHEKMFIQMLAEKAFRPEDSRRMIDTTALVEGDVSRFISNYDCYATLKDPESSIMALLECAKQMTRIASTGGDRIHVENQIIQLFIELADNHFEGEIYTGDTSYMPIEAFGKEPKLRIRLEGDDLKWVDVRDAAKLRDDIERMTNAMNDHKFKRAVHNVDARFEREPNGSTSHDVHVWSSNRAMITSGTIFSDNPLRSEFFSTSDFALWVDFMLEHELPVLDMFTPSAELQNRLEAFTRSRASQPEAEADDPLAPAVEAHTPALK